jgi:hypothetical protein
MPRDTLRRSAGSVWGQARQEEPDDVVSLSGAAEARQEEQDGTT